MSIGDFPEISGQQILVGIILVGRLGVRGLRALVADLARAAALPEANGLSEENAEPDVSVLQGGGRGLYIAKSDKM